MKYGKPEPRDLQEASLARALLELPVHYREAIVLCDLQELSYAAAAKALGCAIGTVRSRLHRGHVRLARELGHMKHDVTGRMPAIKLPTELAGKLKGDELFDQAIHRTSSVLSGHRAGCNESTRQKKDRQNSPTGAARTPAAAESSTG